MGFQPVSSTDIETAKQSPTTHTPPCHLITEDHIPSVLIVLQAYLANGFIVSVMVFYPIKPIFQHLSVQPKTKYLTLIVTEKETKIPTLTVD